LCNRDTYHLLLMSEFAASMCSCLWSYLSNQLATLGKAVQEQGRLGISEGTFRYSHFQPQLLYFGLSIRKKPNGTSIRILA
jgi:hypothetical protein